MGRLIASTISLLLVLILTSCPNPIDPEVPDIPTPRELLTATWTEVVPPNTSALIFKVTNNTVLFQHPNEPISPIGTYGNFQLVSYDGTTVKILDFDDAEVTFSATIVDGVLTVSGLNAIKIFDEPFDPRNYRRWNATYTK